MGLFAVLDNNGNIPAACSGSGTNTAFSFAHLTDYDLVVTDSSASLSGTNFLNDISNNTEVDWLGLPVSSYFFAIPGYSGSQSPAVVTVTKHQWQDMSALQTTAEGEPLNYQLGNYCYFIGRNPLDSESMAVWFAGGIDAASYETNFLEVANRLPDSAGNYATAAEAWGFLTNGGAYKATSKYVVLGKVGTELGITQTNPF